MAANSLDEKCLRIIDDASKGRFSPIYLLMGDEPYYPELVCKAIQQYCVPEEEKDFNETVCYGSDVKAEDIIAHLQRYPMMSERQIVIVKEAQLVKDLDNLSSYCKSPLETSVLVLLFRRASLDKRKSLYKEISKCGVVVDSPEIKDYAITDWIIQYFAKRKLKIEPTAASLLGEYAGTDLNTIATQTDKLLRNLPEGTKEIRVEDIERNIGISRQFSIFELTKELSSKNSKRALELASRLGSSAKFNMPMAVSALYTHFYRILKYNSAIQSHGVLSAELKAQALAGVNPYFYKEYDRAARNYPLNSAIQAISLLCEYDYLGKGGSSTDPRELFRELIAKLLSL